jgi:hypothetical protein
MIIRRDVQFDENILACEPNSMFVPSTTCEPYLTFVSSSVTILVSSSSDDDSEDENPPPPAHLPLDESNEHEHEPAPTPPLPRWVYSTRERTGDIVGDPLDQHQTRS